MPQFVKVPQLRKVRGIATFLNTPTDYPPAKGGYMASERKDLRVVFINVTEETIKPLNGCPITIGHHRNKLMRAVNTLGHISNAWIEDNKVMFLGELLCNDVLLEDLKAGNVSCSIEAEGNDTCMNIVGDIEMSTPIKFDGLAIGLPETCAFQNCKVELL